MMKIVDFIVVTYYAIFKKYGIKGLEAGIFVLLLPLTFNILSLFFYLSSLINYKTGNITGPFLIFIFGMAIAFSAKKFLNKVFLKKFEYIDNLSEKYPRILLIMFPIIHWPLSVFFVVYCLKFT